MTAAESAFDTAEWLRQLSAIETEEGRRSFVSASKSFQSLGAVEALHGAVLRLVYADPRQASRASEAAAWLAEGLHDDAASALSLRSAAHVGYVSGLYEEAASKYEQALCLFERLGHDVEIGRTLSSALQTLIYLGRYDQAFEWARRAQDCFQRNGDELRLGRLTSNIGNILYRQDRHEEALAAYRKAGELLKSIGEPRDIAAVLSNMAVCHTSLGQFAPAVHYYQEARQYCLSNGLPMLAAAADYNIAWLHYLRGDYLQAMKLYEATRRHCARVADEYHAALSNLDESELLLDLNLTGEAADLAREAAAGFERLGMGYERAKALVNLAIVESQHGDTAAALELFHEASGMFAQERNHAWPALIQLYEAVVHLREKRFLDANRLARAAWPSLSRSSMPGKAALCRLVQAELLLAGNRPHAARRRCIHVLGELGERAPSLRFHAAFLLGRVEEQAGNHEAAFRAYEMARQQIENLRSRLWADDLKISILRDKLSVYERMASMLVDGRISSADPAAETFALIQHAKSRSLADQIMPEPAARDAVDEDSEARRELRSELNWHYRELENIALLGDPSRCKQITAIRLRIAERERALGRLRSEARSPRTAVGASRDGLSAEAIRASIPPDATLLEYYEVRGVFHVCVLTARTLRIVPLSAAAKTRDAIRLFHFQMGKFHLGQEYSQTFARLLHRAALAHLRTLYQELIAPVRHLLETPHLIVAPHGILHQAPFHAFFDGTRFLLDDFTVSAAPSAGVYSLCSARQTTAADESLVLGIPDDRAPWIEDEARAAAALLPATRLFIGPDASEEQLRTHAPHSRFIHIASHGLFRRDNPAFSALRLGDSWLTLYDLYRIPLSAELVVLSGCSTGMSAVTGGDELIGLMRGLLYSGAHCLLLSLWDVQDHSTSEFIHAFYRTLGSGQSKAQAFRTASLELRDRYPHPLHWAPFILIGKHE